MAKIMIVEDDSNLRVIYGDRLTAEGYEIVSASDGEEALAIAVKEKPDLIISDVMMPKISGFDMLDILRSTPETKDTKVIMMTALSQAEDKERADKLGADKYLVKSQVTLDDLARVVNEVISASDPARSVTPTPLAAASPAPIQAAPSLPASPPAPLFTSPTPATPEPSLTPMPSFAAPSIPATQATPVVTSLPDPVQAADEATNDAAASNEEKADISAQIENFISTNAAAPEQPVIGAPEPSAQEHARNALDTTSPLVENIEQSELKESAASLPQMSVEPTQPKEPTVPPPSIPTEPVDELPVSTPEPDVEVEAVLPLPPSAQTEPVELPEPEPDPDPEADAAQADTPAFSLTSAGKKVIEPLHQNDSKPNIYDLYEKEMADQAVQATSMSAPPTLPPTPAPPVAVPQLPPDPNAPVLNPPVGTVISPPAASAPNDEVPHKDDPGAIAL